MIDLDEDEKTILKLISEKQRVKVWIKLNCLMTRSNEFSNLILQPFGKHLVTWSQSVSQ